MERGGTLQMKNNYPPVQMYKERRIVPLGTFYCVLASCGALLPQHRHHLPCLGPHPLPQCPVNGSGAWADCAVAGGASVLQGSLSDTVAAVEGGVGAAPLGWQGSGSSGSSGGGRRSLAGVEGGGGGTSMPPLPSYSVADGTVLLGPVDGGTVPRMSISGQVRGRCCTAGSHGGGLLYVIGVGGSCRGEAGGGAFVRVPRPAYLHAPLAFFGEERGAHRPAQLVPHKSWNRNGTHEWECHGVADMTRPILACCFF